MQRPVASEMVHYPFLCPSKRTFCLYGSTKVSPANSLAFSVSLSSSTYLSFCTDSLSLIWFDAINMQIFTSFFIKV